MVRFRPRLANLAMMEYREPGLWGMVNIREMRLEPWKICRFLEMQMKRV